MEPVALGDFRKTARELCPVKQGAWGLHQEGLCLCWTPPKKEVNGGSPSLEHSPAERGTVVAVEEKTFD